MTQFQYLEVLIWIRMQHKLSELLSLFSTIVVKYLPFRGQFILLNGSLVLTSFGGIASV